MVKELKKRVIFPYIVENPLDITITQFKDKYLFKNIPSNQIKYGANHLVLVIDKTETKEIETKEKKKEKREILCGRFFKLRKYIPSVLNVKPNPEERYLDILPTEEVKEQSHFIWDYEKNIIIAEYNHEGVRHFSFPLSTYLNNSFKLIKTEKTDDKKEESEEEQKLFSIDPKKVPNTLTLAKQDAGLKSIFIRIADTNMKKFEDECNADVLSLLWSFSSDKKGYMEIKIKSRRGLNLDKNHYLNTQNILRIMR